MPKTLPKGMYLRGKTYFARFKRGGREVYARLSTDYETAKQILHHMICEADRGNYLRLINNQRLIENDIERLQEKLEEYETESKRHRSEHLTLSQAAIYLKAPVKQIVKLVSNGEIAVTIRIQDLDNFMSSGGSPQKKRSSLEKTPPEKRRAPSIRTRFKVLRRDKFMCVYCGRMPPEVKLVVDHVLPFSKGGLTTIDNLASSCRECNSGKSNLLLEA